jgi:hypothetical protein
MNQQDRLHLLAEINFLREQLAELPNTAKLTRMSTAARLKEIELQLAQYPVNEQEPARTRLTFNGRPVIGSHGIFAEFGMKAVNSFTDAIATVAASIFAPLAQSGPIPNREQYQLLITNTALGSFGFELEEYRSGQLSLDEVSPVAAALDQTQAILAATLGSDEDLADSASVTDPRALDKIRGFLQVLADHEAVCTLQYQKRSVAFKDVGQVKSSLLRLSTENLHESEETLQGEFQGVLPKGRTFEFKLANDPVEIVRGRIIAAIQNVELLNHHLNQPVTIKVMTTRVGIGKPRFTLLELPSWEI